MMMSTIVVALSVAGGLLADDSASKPSARARALALCHPRARRPIRACPASGPRPSRDKPEELIEKVAYRGELARRRYARIRFGSPSSTRVTVVIDTTASGEVDLYADADRNLKIDDRDHVAAGAAATSGRRERIWRLPLGVALIENGAVRTCRRAVVFRLGASGQTHGYAVAGFLEGHVTLGGEEKAENARPGQTLAARRVDGDGNGLLTDAQDRLWIDLNRDGHFDPSSEQFLYTSVVNLDGSRYVVFPTSWEAAWRLSLCWAPARFGWSGKARSHRAEPMRSRCTPRQSAAMDRSLP